MSLKSRIEKLEDRAGGKPLSAKLVNFDGDYRIFTRDELEEIIGIKNPTHEQLMAIINEEPKA